MALSVIHPDLDNLSQSFYTGKVRNKGLLICFFWHGLAIAFVDSQPHWDDTAITVVALTASAGFLSFFAPRFVVAISCWLEYGFPFGEFCITAMIHSWRSSRLFLVGNWVGAVEGSLNPTELNTVHGHNRSYWATVHLQFRGNSVIGQVREPQSVYKLL